MEYIIRFLLGGLIVSIFAVIGDIFKPRHFSGIFGAAPTIALSTLGLVFIKDGAMKVATEGRSMMIGVAAFFVYSLFARYLLLKKDWSSIPSTILPYLAWLIVAFGLWFILLR